MDCKSAVSGAGVNLFGGEEEDVIADGRPQSEVMLPISLGKGREEVSVRPDLARCVQLETQTPSPGPYMDLPTLRIRASACGSTAYRLGHVAVQGLPEGIRLGG